MRLSHSKKNSLDYENFHKVLKSDRPSIRPFAMPTEGNEIFPSFEPISTNASARASHLQVKQKPRSRSPYLKTDTGSKSSRKSPLYLRTEESGGGDANDGLIFKISQLKIELNNYREKEKKYQLKINELENDKEMLTMTLEKFKKKFNQNVKENKDDKKKLGPVLESLKLSDLKKNKENRTSKETQTTLEALSKELSDGNNASYKTRFTELLDYLVSKTQEIETHTNNVVGDNVKIRKEIEGYKKLHANIRNNSDIQIKQPETVQTELVLLNKLLGAEIGHLKEYIKELPNFSRVTNKKKNLADLDSQPCAKCSQPVPSYIKALSLALCRNP